MLRFAFLRERRVHELMSPLSGFLTNPVKPDCAEDVSATHALKPSVHDGFTVGHLIVVLRDVREFVLRERPAPGAVKVARHTSRVERRSDTCPRFR